MDGIGKKSKKLTKSNDIEMGTPNGVHKRPRKGQNKLNQVDDHMSQDDFLTPAQREKNKVMATTVTIKGETFTFAEMTNIIKTSERDLSFNVG